MKFKIIDYVGLNGYRLCAERALSLINIIGVEVYLAYMGGITRNSFDSKLKYARKRGSLGTESIISIFAFLYDNNVSEDEIDEVLK